MQPIVSTPRPSVLTCSRIHKGQPSTVEVGYLYTDNGEGLPTLAIFGRWSKRREEFRDVATYTVEEIPTGIDGRAFLLHRDPADIAKDGPDADSYYGVMIARNGQDHLCECRGHQAHAHCKHVDVIRRLVECGHIDHPEADPRPDVTVDASNAPF